MSKVAVIDILPLEIKSMRFGANPGGGIMQKKKPLWLAWSIIFRKKNKLKTVLFECISDLLSKRDTKLQ